MEKSLPVLALFSIFLLVSVPQAFALQEKDVDTSCRDGLVLIFKINAQIFACTAPDTAKTWVKLGIAEYANPDDTDIEFTPEPKQQVELIIVEEQSSVPEAGVVEDLQIICRDKLVLIYRIISNNYICTSNTTAKEWVQLGFAEFVITEKEIIPEEIEEIIEEPIQEETVEVVKEIIKVIPKEITNPIWKTLSGTQVSMQDPGLGHESHQLSIILPPSENVYKGILSYSASEPIQLVALHGPLTGDEYAGQPIWTTDGDTKFALTFIDPETNMGSWAFTGNALAVHTMNEEEFAVSYSVGYMELQSDTSHTRTLMSIQDPGLGHESHQITIMLPPSEVAYSGLMTYAASEPIQLVSLHGPLANGEDLGQAIWTTDGDTKFALTFVDAETNMGTWLFSGNAIAAHTLNEDQFTISYSIASMQEHEMEHEIMKEVMEEPIEEVMEETIIPEITVEYNPEINPDDFTTDVDNPFFTLNSETTLIYAGETDDGQERIEVKITEEDKFVMGVETVVVWDRVWLDGDLIEDTLDWYAQDEDGNVWYFGEDSIELEDGKITSMAGSWEAGVDGALPGIIMYAEPTIGEPYRQEYYPGQAEDMAQVIGVDEMISTPYGVFEGCVKTLDWNPLEDNSEEYKYYCSEIGGLVFEENLVSGEKVELVDAKISN